MLFATLRLDESLGGAPPRSRRLWAWAIVSVACAAAVALGLLFPHQIAHQLVLSLTWQATPHTELYFTDPETLPTRLSVARPNPVRFTVFNREVRERVYAYVVTLTGPSGSSVGGRGAIGLKDNMGGSGVVNVVPTGRHTVYLTTVTITDPPETIHFMEYL